MMACPHWKKGRGCDRKKERDSLSKWGKNVCVHRGSVYTDTYYNTYILSITIYKYIL